MRGGLEDANKQAGCQPEEIGPEPQLPREGWGWPENSKKGHYFRTSGRSLCGKWAYFGRLYPSGLDESIPHCKECERRLAKERAALR